MELKVETEQNFEARVQEILQGNSNFDKFVKLGELAMIVKNSNLLPERKKYLGEKISEIQLNLADLVVSELK